MAKSSNFNNIPITEEFAPNALDDSMNTNESDFGTADLSDKTFEDSLDQPDSQNEESGQLYSVQTKILDEMSNYNKLGKIHGKILQKSIQVLSHVVKLKPEDRINYTHQFFQN